jgi:hypothetical protein
MRSAPSPSGALRRTASLLSTLLGLAFLGAAPSASAQGPGRISGVITDMEGVPLAGAQLHLVGVSVGGLSGADGRYELGGIPVGAHLLVVERLGYRRLEIAVELAGPQRRDVRLQTEPIPLEALRVRVPAARTGPLAGFYERRERGSGTFYTRDEIATMQVRLVTDVLRRVPGAQLQPVTGPFGTAHELTFGRGSGSAGFRACRVAYFVDGVVFDVAPDLGINSFVPVQDVAGIEVYSGSSRIPSQFNSSTGNSRCGVVAIWTWDGRERSQ